MSSFYATLVPSFSNYTFLSSQALPALYNQTLHEKNVYRLSEIDVRGLIDVFYTNRHCCQICVL